MTVRPASSPSLSPSEAGLIPASSTPCRSAKLCSPSDSSSCSSQLLSSFSSIGVCGKLRCNLRSLPGGGSSSDLEGTMRAIRELSSIFEEDALWTGACSGYSSSSPSECKSSLTAPVDSHDEMFDLEWPKAGCLGPPLNFLGDPADRAGREADSNEIG